MRSKPVTNLEGAVVAITGAGRGIGKATADAFVRSGARVALGDIETGLAEAAAGHLGGAIGLHVDVTDRASVEAFIAQTEERLGPIDVFINNAGIGPVSPLAEEDDAVTARVLAINIEGTLHGMKAMLPRMLERGSGHLVNVASTAGKLAFPGAATYCGTKHAIVGITEAARLELRSTPVGLTLVMPGIANTDLASGVKATRGVKIVEPEEVARAIVKAVRTGRFEVFVPRRLGAISKLIAVLPRPVSDLIVRGVGLDQMLLDVDETARREYRARTERGASTHERTGGVKERS